MSKYNSQPAVKLLLFQANQINNLFTFSQKVKRGMTMLTLHSNISMTRIKCLICNILLTLQVRVKHISER